MVVGAESHLTLTVLHLLRLKENFNSSEGSKLNLSFSHCRLLKKTGGVGCSHVNPAWDQVAPGRGGSLWCSPSPPLPPRSPLGQTTSFFPCSTLLMLASTWRAKLACEVSWKLTYKKKNQPTPNLFYRYCISIFFLLQLWPKSHNGQIWV